MSTDENKARVQRFYEEVFKRKNTAALDEFIDAHAVDHSALPVRRVGSKVPDNLPACSWRLSRMCVSRWRT